MDLSGSKISLDICRYTFLVPKVKILCLSLKADPLDLPEPVYDDNFNINSFTPKAQQVCINKEYLL